MGSVARDPAWSAAGRPAGPTSLATSVFRVFDSLILVSAGVGQVLEIDLGGRLLMSDIILLLALPYALARRWRMLFEREARVLLALLLVWLLGAIFTDAIRETPFEDLIRGWSKIIFFMVDFASVYLLVALSEVKLLLFLSTLFAGAVVKLRYFPSGDAAAQVLGGDAFGTGWRFGYGQAFTFFALLFGGWINRSFRTRLGSIVQFGAAVIDLLLEARNLFGIAALAAIVGVVPSNLVGRLGRSGLIIVAIGVAMAGWLIVASYGYLASEGLLGPEAQQKYLMQSSGSFGLILGGRTESLASTQAILDSPIIGHGSWARSTYYVMIRAQKLQEAGYELKENPFQSDLIPTHSILLGAWVEAGIAGAVPWIWILAMTVRGLTVVARRQQPYAAVVGYILITLLWDILFSPFGLDRRFVEAAFICTTFMAIRSKI